MSERNAKLIRRWAKVRGVDPHHPDNDGMGAIFRNNDPVAKRKLRDLLGRPLRVEKKLGFQVRDFNSTPSRSVRKRLGL